VREKIQQPLPHRGLNPIESQGFFIEFVLYLAHQQLNKELFKTGRLTATKLSK
jgi:hypothetical protein